MFSVHILCIEHFYFLLNFLLLKLLASLSILDLFIFDINRFTHTYIDTHMY